MKIFLLTLFLFILQGCATTQNYQEKLDRWRGTPIQTVINKWGRPESAVKNPDGTIEYMFKRSQFYIPPGYPTVGPTVMTAAGPRVSPGYDSSIIANQTVTRSCTTWFDVNHDGIITGSRFAGDNCVASNPALRGFISAGMIGGFL